MILAIFFGLGILDLGVLRYINWAENKRRDKRQLEDPDSCIQPEDASARDLTDREQPAFRYML